MTMQYWLLLFAVLIWIAYVVGTGADLNWPMN